MIFMTQKTAKGDNKIYEEMDKHFHIHSMFNIFCISLTGVPDS